MTTAAILVQSNDLDGALNMALDEVLWDMAAQGAVFARIYGWADRPVLSLGYFQSYEEVRCAPALALLPFVRRLTGGGAIVHDDEITYSLALPASLAPPPRRLYWLVHSEIARRLTELGIPAQIGWDGAAVHPDRQPLCFDRSDELAVRVHGVKVMGSAQRRRSGAVLMHGSLLLGSSPHAPHVLGIRDLLSHTCDAKEIEGVVLAGIQSALGLSWQSLWLPQPGSPGHTDSMVEVDSVNPPELVPSGQLDESRFSRPHTDLGQYLLKQASYHAEVKYRSMAWNHKRRGRMEGGQTG